MCSFESELNISEDSCCNSLLKDNLCKQFCNEESLQGQQIFLDMYKTLRKWYLGWAKGLRNCSTVFQKHKKLLNTKLKNLISKCLHLLACQAKVYFATNRTFPRNCASMCQEIYMCGSGRIIIHLIMQPEKLDNK